MLFYRPGLLTCTVVVGIEHGKKRANHEDVGILVEHLDGGMLCQSMIETGYLVLVLRKRARETRAFMFHMSGLVFLIHLPTLVIEKALSEDATPKKWLTSWPSWTFCIEILESPCSAQRPETLVRACSA
jgi:hypothetical protein